MEYNYEKLLTIKAAADFLSVRASTLYMWAASGKIPHIRLGRTVRFKMAQLIEFIDNNSVTARETPTPPRKQKNKVRSGVKISKNNKYLDDLLKQVKNDVLNNNQ